jgi:hypothetical protein
VVLRVKTKIGLRVELKKVSGKASLAGEITATTLRGYGTAGNASRAVCRHPARLIREEKADQYSIREFIQPRTPVLSTTTSAYPLR